MKKLSLIIAALLWAVTAVAEDPCPCANGTKPYQVDCNGDGAKTACEWSECPAPTVSVTAGGGDVKQGCYVTWDCSVTEGSGNYDYFWYFSTGQGQLTTKSGQVQAAVLGPGQANVTVTDLSSGKNSHASQSYHIRKQVETVENVNEVTYDGPFRPISASLTCPAELSDPCVLAFSITSSITLTVGLTVTGGVNAPLVKAEVSGTTSASHTSETGITMHFPVAPGTSRRVGIRAQIKKREGTYSEYGCNGLIRSGTWADIKEDPDASLCWDYSTIPAI